MSILKTAALELSELDNTQVIKMAGILRRLKNWYRKMTDPAFKEEFLKLQNDSALVKTDLDELYKNINEVQKAIKYTDIEAYNYSMDKIREISKRLSTEMVEFKQEANQTGKRIFEKEYPDLPASLDRIETIHISNDVRNAAWNVQSIKTALSRHNIPNVEEFVNDSNKLNEFYNNMAKAIKGGEIIKSWESPETAKKIDRKGELQYLIVTAPFVIPGTNFKVRVTVEGTDLSSRKHSPIPKFSVRKINYIDARQARKNILHIIIKNAARYVFEQKEPKYIWTKEDKEVLNVLKDELVDFIAENFKYIPEGLRLYTSSYIKKIVVFIVKQSNEKRATASVQQVINEMTRFRSSISRLATFSRLKEEFREVA